jgi:hypothetical protein
VVLAGKLFLFMSKPAATSGPPLVAFSLPSNIPQKGATMTWTFHVLATEQRRLLSRILQVLDVQMVRIHFFSGEEDQNGFCVTFVVSSEQDKACRIKGLLHRLDGVISVATESDS